MINDLNIVLVEPEIPQNTGNVARSCAATGAALHLVHPFGFSIDDRKMRRAGLDYWDKLDITFYDSLADFLGKNAGAPMYFFSTKAERVYTEPHYEKGCFLVFGKETKGLPESLLKEHYDRCVRLPMRRALRSLNLSNTVAVGVYEALRQWGFPALQNTGELPRALSEL